jgi:hypothetical protein
MISTSKRTGLPASGWLKSTSTASSSSSRTMPVNLSPLGAANSIRPCSSGLEFRRQRRRADALGQLRIVAAEGLVGFQQEDVRSPTLMPIRQCSSVGASSPLPSLQVAGVESKVLTSSCRRRWRRGSAA